MNFAHLGNGGFGNYDRRGMTGLIFTWLMLLLMIVPAIATASHDHDDDHHEQALFGPKKYVRLPGKPYTWTSTFTACSVPSSATLQLTNGSGSKSRVSSAVVTLNGVKVIAEKDLNRNVPILARTVNLKSGLNTVTVTIKSGSGSNDDNYGEQHDGDDEHSGDGENDPTAVYLTLKISGKACGSSDTVPPVFSAPQPADGALLAVAKPPISIAFSDNSGGSGVDTASVRVSLDGSDITNVCSVSATGIACTPAGNLNDGMHSVTVAVSDLAKNPASYSWRFTIDTTPPKIIVTTPQNGQNLGNPLFNVTGTVDDASASITVTSTALSTSNGVSATLSGLAFSAANVPLVEGGNTITVIALDQLGNQSTTSLNVTLDTSLPVVTITAPVDGSFTNVPTVTVSGTISEAPDTVTINGRSATLTGQNFSLENLPLAEGQNSIAVEASDLAGNKGRSIVGITLDTVKPQIFITAPADGLLTRNPQLTVSGTVSEPLASLTVNGQAVAVDGLAFTTLLTLNEGVNSITLEATDRAGNKNSVAISVTLDSTPPVVPVLEAVTSPTNNPLVVVKGSAEAGSSVILSAAGVQLASTVTDSAGLFSFTGLTLSEGETLFTAQATDSAGNIGQPSAPLAVVLDTVAPSLAVSNPLDGTILNTPVITISGSIDDPAAAVSVNGLAAINSGSVWTLGNLTLQEGKNTLLVEARDPAGNKGSVSATIVLDTLAPVVTITTPLDGLYTNIPQLTVSGTVNEDVASVMVNGVVATISTVSPGSSLFTATLTLTEGTNSIIATAIDKAGNQGTATVNVTLDTIAPQLTVIGPDDGALLNNGQIIFGGNSAEPVSSLLVNGVAAQVGTNGGYTLPVTLVEGSNTLTVTATDRAGNHTTSTINVTLDSTPPASPLLDPLATPTRIGTTVVSGQAEANAQVKLFNNGQLIATLKADAAGLFSVPSATLTEGNNPFTAQAVDAAGNTSLVSAPLTVVLDTKAPVITVTAPQPGVVISTAQVTIMGTVDEALAFLTVNGGAAVLNGNAFEYLMTLAAGENSALITATDLAGNIATTTLIIQRDSIPPKVTISAPLPGLLTNSPQIQVSGTVDDPEAVVTVGGAAVSLLNKTYSFGYVLTDGDNNIVVKAVDKAGNEGAASVVVTLDAMAPVVSLNAPATATAGANVSITINATDNRTLTLAELRANGVPIWSASPSNSASVTETIGYRLSPDLNTGAEVTLQARALDSAGNVGITTVKIIISQAAAGPGYVQGKVLDDIRGLRMEGATVSVTDSKGATKTATSGSDGGYFFEIPSGEALVKITRPGYTAVERRLAVRPEQKVTVLDARLTKTSDTKGLIDATGGVVKSTPFKIQNSSFTIDVTLPANALGTQADLRITPVSNQGLIGTLPLGWSPLSVADMRLLDPVTGSALDSVFATASTARFTTPAIANLATSTLSLARYDETAHQWLTAGNATPAPDGLSATADILASGQYAVVISDPTPNAPQAAQSGQPLAAAALQSLDYSLVTAAGKVIPQAAPPSAGLKAAGEVVVTVKADAAQQPVFTSGLLLGGRITEKFDLLSGDKVEPVSYTQDIVLYRHPCITNIGAGSVTPPAGVELRTTFPVSPSKDYTIVDLLLGKVGIEILPPDTTETGIMVGTDGGRILDADGNILVIPQGALSQTTPVSTKSVAASAAIGDDFTLIKAVEVNLTRQTLTTSATLSIPAPTGLDANLPLVIARGVTVKGVNKLKLVALAKQNGSFVSSDTAVAGITLSGVTTSGTYYFLQGKAPLGFVTGAISDASNNPFAGALVKTDSGSLIDLSENSGKYLLAAPVAPFNATATDLYKGDEVTAAGAITAANQAVTLNLVVRMIPPRVNDITPANGATNVQPSVPVVVTFSKLMEKTTINSATLAVRDAADNPVSGVLTFNVDNTAVTFYPSDAFKQETGYTMTVSASVKDVQGYPLGQNIVSSFTVRRTTPPVMPPAGAISGTFPDADGFITVSGTQGSAETGNTVLLINDTSGEIQSVTPASNGSFTGKVRGQLGDEIKVVLMDYSGNQTVISYLTFKGQDGSYLVSAKGGTITGEGGSQLDIPEGALVGATVLKITSLLEENLPHPVPEGGKFLGAVNIDTAGFDFRKEVKLSIPLPPNMPTGAVPFLAKPIELTSADGGIEKVYEVIDSTKIVNGRLTTASPPFDGVMSFGSFVFLYVTGPIIGDVIVSGTAYRDMDGLPGYTSGVDKPIQGAVIRSPQSANFISYSKADGHYATFGFAANGSCRDFPISAVHPQTMYKSTVNISTCAAPYIVNNLNFKLADKDTVLPDKAAPIITLNMQVAPGQASDNRIIAGTVVVGTEIQVPVSILDQQMGSATMTVTFTDPMLNETNSVLLSQSGMPTLFTPMTGAKPAIWRYNFETTFSSPIAATSPINFRPGRAGLYNFIVEATDIAANKSRQSLQLRVVSADTSLGESKDGPPTVDSLTPSNGAKDVMVSIPVTAVFNEPVINVTSDTFKLIDLTAGRAPGVTTEIIVPATVTTGIVNGRMQAVLTPKGNLYYDRDYQVVLTGDIKDLPDKNDSATTTDKRFTLAEVRTTFSTKKPTSYELADDSQFIGRAIDLYYDRETMKLYAYVATGDTGFKTIEVTDPTNPVVLKTINHTAAGVSWNYRYVAVHPEQPLLALTEDITYVDGTKFGYLRLYDLTTPSNPIVIGKEKLSEAYSGIPGRIALYSDYAFIATINSGIQVVSISQAKASQAGGKTSDGSSIVGVFDSVGQGLGHPSDIIVPNGVNALFTTTSGSLVTLDITTPAFPTLVSNIGQNDGRRFTRIAAAMQYQYMDTSNMPQSMDLVIASSQEGKIRTIDMSNPASPQVLAVAQDETGTADATITAMDLVINKESGLAFATGLNTVYVIDIKNPFKPKLINRFTSLYDPNGSPITIPLGQIPSIVERGGWIYAASLQKGIKILNFDPPTIVPAPGRYFVLLDKDNKTQQDYMLTYHLKTDPGTNGSFENMRVILYKDNNPIKTYTDVLPETQLKLIEAGTVFDIDSTYHARVIVYDKQTRNDVTGPVIPIVIGKFSIMDAKEKNSNLVGAVTDGTSKLILSLKVSPNYQGIELTFSLIDPILGVNKMATGTLLINGKEVTAAVISIDPTTMTAKVKYQAPAKFIRTAADATVSERSVSVSLGLTDIYPEIRLKRPPVVLVHGVWAKPKNWGKFEKLMNPDRNNKQYDILKIDYEANNAGSFESNYPQIKTDIGDKIDNVRKSGFAITTVNYVGHSMGGLLLKEYCLSPGENCANVINKYVSIDSPHKGSELANIILDVNKKQADTCYEMLEFMESVNNQIWEQNTNRTIVTGALIDLAVGSEALKKQENYIPPFPWRAIVGVQDDGSFGGFDGGFDYWILWSGLRGKCNLVPDNSFPTSLLGTTLKPVFSDKNDRIVSRNSQNGISSDTMVVNHVNHSSVLGQEETVKAVKQFIEE